MKYLLISNEGLLEVQLIALMGGTTKRDDKFKIGQFGTGLKYTLAYLFRKNIDFKVFVGERHVPIEVRQQSIGGQSFDVIYIDGERTSITTQMGYDWEAWMILRELWCNALDEGHAEREITTSCAGKEGHTTFFIQLSEEVQRVHDNWDNYFVPANAIKMEENERFAILPSKGHLRLYKQGVLIYEEKAENALFNYDLKDATINELREYKGYRGYDICKCLAAAKVRTIEYFLEHVKEDHLEGKMDYNWIYTQFGENWKTAIGGAKIITDEAIKNIRSRGVDIDTVGLIVLPESVYKHLTKTFEGISALRVSEKLNEFYETYVPELESKTKQALAVLESCGYFIDPELKFCYGVFGDKRVLGQVSQDKKEILLSERLCSLALFELVTTLIEENEHYRTEMEDCSRPFQQHFINMFTKQLLEKHEIIL